MSQVGAAPTSQRRLAVDSRMSRCSRVDESCRLASLTTASRRLVSSSCAVQRGVGHRLGGDLGEAAQELVVGEPAGPRVEQADEAGDVVRRTGAAAAAPRRTRLSATRGARTPSAGIAATSATARGSPLSMTARAVPRAARSSVAPGYAVSTPPAADAHQAAQRVVLDDGDVAAGDAGFGVDAGGDRDRAPGRGRAWSRTRGPSARASRARGWWRSRRSTRLAFSKAPATTGRRCG